jgi:CobQ-like glutamine amidotransferase family enzyme
MELTLLHFYPDLMSLYGSYANVLLLKKHLEDLGNTVTVRTVRPGEDADVSAADFVFMGAGTERSQKAALADFRRFGDAVKSAAGSGTAMLFAGTAMELLGKTIVDDAGTVYDGIGLGGFTSTQGKKRFVGDVYGSTDLYEPAVVGFMNKCAVITGVEDAAADRLRHGLRQRDGARSGGLPLRQCAGLRTHRPAAGEEPADAGRGNCRHLPQARRDAAGDDSRLSLRGRRLRRHRTAAEAAQ